MLSNPAVVTVIENSSDNKGEGGSFGRAEKMEEEALICFNSWRKRAGKLKEIPIYAICPSERTLPKTTVVRLADLGVTYIEAYQPETMFFECGYWNVPIALIWAEDNLTEEFFIHIDLDMTLLVEPDESLFYCEPDVLAKIGTIWDTRWGRTIEPRYKTQFETCFINSWRKNGFYKNWFHELVELERRLINKKADPNFRWSEVEEHCIDYMYYDAGYKIEPIQYFQIGTWYSVDSIPQGHIKDVAFHHDHVDVDKDKVMRDYTLRRIKGV